ncbi:histidinol-phosphate transaminase [Imtechella halotolerans]|uniref:Histidinol-phosphate aminotransferase n=1 Tax=Imtechella halotolerans K1 TaxID=946077 RepID=I0W737_9FLAO|nr:histidinol-phosphate aminotransferase [Imtechella halotolerans K1]
MMKTTKFTLDSLVRVNVKRLTPYSSARDEFKDSSQDMIFLDANENPFENGVNRYPDPQQRSLKQELARIKGVDSNQILLGNGSDEVLDLLFRAFCEPGVDNIITLPPTYGMYSVLADTNAVENREVLLTSDFQPDEIGVMNAADEYTKITFLCSPNNPTANSFESKKIEKILENTKGLVVIDEAYIDFSSQQSWLSKLQKYPNLIVVQTLSKAYGLAGIRLGICYASQEIISVLTKIKPPYNVNELTQKKALQRVVDQKGVKSEIDLILAERALLIKALGELPYVNKVFPTDANFILAEVDDAQLRYTQLLKAGVVVRNRSTQPMCTNTLRFTIGTSEENKQLINVLTTLKN